MPAAHRRLAGDDAPADLLEALERHRDHHFRRIPSRRVSGERTALRFIEEVGFCTAFSAGYDVPCLREAIVGEREPVADEHIQHDYGIVMTWRIKDALPEKRLVYYGKVIGGKPSFIARDMLGAFLRLRVAPVNYKRLYERGMLSHCAKLVMDTLSKRGASETRVLKLSSGYAQPKRRAEFDRAMREVQEKFLALKVEERADPFSYVWDTVEHRWHDAMRQARSLSPLEAAERIVRRYFEIAGFGSERAIARTLSIDAPLVDRAARRLERKKLVRRNVRVENFPGRVTILDSLCATLDA
jgi:hypothetical protein